MDSRIRKVVEILDQRWHVALSVHDLASNVGLGASRLEHLFKQEAQVSIRDFVRERRLTAAAYLLATTLERVSVISFRVGYQHAANFNHAFRKRYNMTPREYRSRMLDRDTAENAKQMQERPSNSDCPPGTPGYRFEEP